VFINLANNASLDAQGFAPFGKVTSGMKVVNKLYAGYGEAVTNLQGSIATQGNPFLKKRFPKLDSVIRARVVK
jgi:peptidyl-prolyl cis-trans isomerase A (cyclophilin A)